MYCYQIENGNDIGGVVLQLSVKRSVELENVVAIDVKGVLLGLSNNFEEADVVGVLIKICILLHIEVILFIIYNGKSCEELFEFGLEIIGVDVGSPKDLGI